MEKNPRIKFNGTPEPETGIKFLSMNNLAQMWQENKTNKQGKTFQEAILEQERRNGGVFEWRKALHYSQSDNVPDHVKTRINNNKVLQELYKTKIDKYKKGKENESINN